jgi:hypothetical protein
MRSKKLGEVDERDNLRDKSSAGQIGELRGRQNGLRPD